MRAAVGLPDVLMRAAAGLGLLFTAALGSAQPVVNVAIVIDGPWERNEEVESRFRDEILALTRGEFDVRFPDEVHVVGDWTVERVDAALDDVLADPEVDLVLAMGIIASDRVVRRRDLLTPVVAPFIIDAEIQDAPRAGGASGIPNLAYLASSLTYRRNIEMFRELRDFERLALLHDPSLDEIPGVRRRLEEASADMGLALTLVPVRTRAEDALARIPTGTEAVYVNPLLQLVPGELEKLAEGLIEQRLPSFSVLGRSEVERGLLMSLGEDVFQRRARRVALDVQRILLGEDPGSFAVDFVQREDLVINMATARKIDVFPSFALETVADLLQEERPDAGLRLDVRLAAEQAAEANRDLAALEREVTAGAENIPIARSFLLPQLDFTATGTVIDADRSQATGAPRASFSPGVTLRQLVFSDAAWAGRTIQEDRQRALELDRERFRLDVVQQATTAYYAVMQAFTRERIQRENLELTRSNLELAQVRVSIGASSASDVYRWQAQIASDQDGVIRASAARNLAEIEVNRLRHRPLEESFRTEETGIDDPAFLYVRDRFYPYLSSRQYFDVTRDALVALGLEQSPELVALEALIEAQERQLLGTRRAFTLPEVFFQGAIERQFRSGGFGFIDGLSNLLPGAELSVPDNVNWSLGLSASFPLFTSGNRPAARRQAGEALSQLRFQRESAAERVEQRIRSALHVVGASYAGIDLAEHAAEASRNNLELVSDAYAQGTLSILELLDAQNASLVAEEAAANAIYVFLSDMLEVERALGKFYSLAPPDEVDALFEHLDRYFTARGRRPPSGKR